MKRISLVILTLLMSVPFSHSLYAQWPQIFTEQEDVLKHGIKKLTVTLDSAAENFQLPFDTVKYIMYREDGIIKEQMNRWSDMMYLQQVTTRSFHGPYAIVSRRVTIRSNESFNKFYEQSGHVELYRNNRLAAERHESKDRIYRNYTETYEYDEKGRLIRETRFDDIDPSEGDVRHKQVIDYVYDEQGRKTNSKRTDFKTNSETEIFNTTYTYSPGKMLKLAERKDWNTETLWVERTDYILNDKDQIIKETEYTQDGSIWNIRYYTYYENGLLKTEKSYTDGTEFAYIFKTTYEFE